MKQKLLVVTGNPVKFRELSERLSGFFDCEQREFHEPEIQGTPEEILMHKALRAYEIFKQPILVDDTSVHFDELGGFPGPYMKHFWDHLTPQELGTKFAGSRMRVVCRLALCRNAADITIATGEVGGTIIKPPHNNHKGQEFDLFLVADGTDKPMIEFSVEEKNKFSHRGRAIKDLIAKLGETRK